MGDLEVAFLDGRVGKLEGRPPCRPVLLRGRDGARPSSEAAGGYRQPPQKARGLNFFLARRGDSWQ